MKTSQISIALSIIAIILAGYALINNSKLTAKQWDDFAAGYQERQQGAAQKEASNIAKNIAPISDTDHVEGNRDADITIYEYSDFECPFCKRFSSTTSEIVAKSGGKVNTVYRHFDGLHAPLSTKEANAAECAAEQGGDEAFFAYHHELYKRTASNGRSLTIKGKADAGLDLAELPKIAEKLGLDVDKFNTCVAENRYSDKIKADTQSGVAAGIQGTPGVIVKNNKTGEVIVGRGAEPIENIQFYVNELLK